MHKDLGFDAEPGAGANFGKAHLAREHGARKALFGEKLNRRAVVRGHLRARVQRHFGRDFARQARHAEILNQRRVRAGGGDFLNGLNQRGLLVLAHQRIQRDVHANAARMRIGNGVRERVSAEIVGALARVEAACAEIDRVRAALHGGDQRVASAGGREQFRLEHVVFLS